MTIETESHESIGGDQKKPFIARAVRFLLSFLLVVILGIGLGAGIYYGIPALYNGAIAPGGSHIAQVSDVETDLDQAVQEFQNYAEETSERLAELEGRLAEQIETNAELQTTVESMKTEVKNQSDEIATLSINTDRIDKLVEDLALIDKRVDNLEEILGSAEAPTQKIGRQLQMLRALSLLDRARLHLVEGNLGSAVEVATEARDIIAAVIENAPEDEIETLTQIVERIDLALKNMEKRPILAAGDLEIAWNELIEATAP